MPEARLRPSPHRLRAIALAAVCAAAVIPTACGGDDGGPANASNDEGAGMTSEVRDRVREVLVDDQALTDSEADCAIGRLEEELADRPIELDQAGALPPEATRAAFEAGIACAGR